LIEVTIPLKSHEEAILVLGPYDRHAKLLEQALAIEIYTKNGNLRLRGDDQNVVEAQRRVEHLLGKVRKGRDIDARDAESILLGNAAPAVAPSAERSNGGSGSSNAHSAAPKSARTARSGPISVKPFEGRTEHQRRYLEAIQKRSLTFGIGTAGTGKTFLAVASAVRALRAGEVKRLVVTRPVVEAGEHLGFLPGDLQAKLNPYMRPVYDALSELIDFEDVPRLEEQNVLEIAPLAYMRGRTLAHSFVILDEGQNTTVPQMRMFLTRLGEGSRMVVTGDPTQSDLPRGVRSGLLDAVGRLQGFADIGVVEFDARDIQRHPLVEQIVRAYEAPTRIGNTPDENV
jgi:phosphate starvation-inducible protein PhoH and related proteins